MVIVHSGSSDECKSQAAILQDEFYEPYHDLGLSIVLIIFEDDGGARDWGSVLDYSYAYKQHFGLSFKVLADPNHDKTGIYHEDVPLTMLLDENLVIQFRQEGSIPDTPRLKQYIEDLLN
jgi:hypothetical protein